MRIELKAFQDEATRKLHRYVQSARRDAADGDPQAIILSSPTGSGKTVALTALMEWIYEGYESHPPDRSAVFLWVSDSPELNAQSRDKILRQSSVFRPHQLVVIEPPFSQEVLEPGNVYFLNTQKLGKDSLLTKSGDGRNYTIWQTIQNTAAAKPTSFYLIIDEAHRGMTQKPGEQAQAQSLVQRLVKGETSVGLEPVPLVLGMSATPERFGKVVEGSGRIKREVVIDPDGVKVSGLLKDWIVLYHPEDDQPADWTLLREAVQRWQMFGAEWESYCVSQEMVHIVRPVLVVQVQDGSDKVLTHTNLDRLVEIVEEETGRLPEGAWAHAFQEDKEIEAGGQKIRKIEASKIEEDPTVRVVLFKMSLTTGWDCPRAEVMMSFRTAQDHTLIAQLVGRMVRTPLARSVEGQDFLNTVSLYLPHYNEEGLKTILDKLNDPEVGPPTGTQDGRNLVTLQRAPDKSDLFDMLATLPTYRVDHADRTSETRRLLRLARRLTILDAIDPDANREAKKLVVDTLNAELARLSADPQFVGRAAANQEIEIREVRVEYGDWQELSDAKTLRIKATPENIDDMFEHSGRMLGEGLHMEYWKASSGEDDPYRAKLELYGLVQDKATWGRLEKACKERVRELFERHDAAIRAQPTSIQDLYWRINRIAKDPEAETLRPFHSIETLSQQPLWSHHLYVDKNGMFGADLNTWEAPVLKEEMARSDFAGWLRNIPRQQWALSVSYEMGKNEFRSLFPDLLIFRRVDGKIVVDILDPHGSYLADATFKARGLADFAEKHGALFGRIEIIVKTPDDVLKRFDLQNPDIRGRVRDAKDQPELDKVFEELG